MLSTILVILLILWALGYISIPGIVIKNITLFHFRGHAISLWDVLIFLVILWAIEALPSPLRQITVLFVLLWLLSTLGVIVIAGLKTIVIIAIVAGLIFAILQGE